MVNWPSTPSGGRLAPITRDQCDVNIYTIGYEGDAIDAVIRRLQRAEVRLLVDVREAPVSRKRNFSKNALSNALHSKQIDYVHLHSLGCPKPIRDRYRVDRDWVAYTVAFMSHLAAQSAAISEVASLCRERRSALLCYEANPRLCHRTYVARAVAALTGSEVWHIGASGITEDDPFAPAGDQATYDLGVCSARLFDLETYTVETPENSVAVRPPTHTP